MNFNGQKQGVELFFFLSFFLLSVICVSQEFKTSPCEIKEDLNTPFTAYELFKLSLNELDNNKVCEAANSLATVILITPDVDKAFLQSDLFCNARFDIAEKLFSNKSYATALIFYNGYVNYCYDELKTPKAYFNLADAFFGMKKSPDFDPHYTEMAITNFLFFIRNFPHDAYIPEAKKKFKLCYDGLAMYEFNIGLYYFNNKQYKAALERFKFLCIKFPNSSSMPEAMHLISKCHDKLQIEN